MKRVLRIHLSDLLPAVLLATLAVPANPLVLYLPKLDDLSSITVLPEDRKLVRVAVVSASGSISPTGSKVVWPVSRTSKQ